MGVEEQNNRASSFSIDHGENMVEQVVKSYNQKLYKNIYISYDNKGITNKFNTGKRWFKEKRKRRWQIECK